MPNRRPKFAMSTSLIVALTLCGCGAGVDAEKQREVAEAVFRAGGTLKLQDSDLKLTAMDELPTEGLILGSVDLNQTNATDEDVKILEGLNTIEYLGLHSTYVTDVGIEYVKTLKGLYEIELSYTAITDKSLPVLAELPALKKVFIYDTAVSDEAIEEFKKKRPGCLIVR